MSRIFSAERFQANQSRALRDPHILGLFARILPSFIKDLAANIRVSRGRAKELQLRIFSNPHFRTALPLWRSSRKLLKTL